MSVTNTAAFNIRVQVFLMFSSLLRIYLELLGGGVTAFSTSVQSASVCVATSTTPASQPGVRV